MFEFEAMGSFFIDAPLIIHLLTVCFIQVFYLFSIFGQIGRILLGEKNIFGKERVFFAGGGGGIFTRDYG